MSPVYLGGTRLNELRIGGTRINKGYVGSTLVYSSEFIGAVTITTVIRYAGILIADTSCVPAGAEVAMIASFSGTATDATFAWSRPAGSSAPIEGLTTGTLSWTAVAGDGGTYGVTVTSRNSPDSPQAVQETINIFSYVAPGFADVDANNWIINVELRDCSALETGVRNAMNQLVLDLKAAGYYSNSLVIHPLIGARNARALAPLKAPDGWFIQTPLYNRQSGLAITNENFLGVSHPRASLSSAFNAGTFGMAAYCSSWADPIPPGATPHFFARFFEDSAEIINPAAIAIDHEFGFFQGELLNRDIIRFNDNATAPIYPVFVGLQGNGSLASMNLKLRANNLFLNETRSGMIAQPADSFLKFERLPQSSERTGHYVENAFLIAGSGSSDYSSSALRTIIEAYVTAIQTAIPG